MDQPKKRGRPAKPKTPKAPKPIPEGYMFNPFTNRNVKITSRTGQLLTRAMTGEDISTPKKRGRKAGPPKPRPDRPYKEGVLNPASGRIVSSSGLKGRKLLSAMGVLNEQPKKRGRPPKAPKEAPAPAPAAPKTSTKRKRDTIPEMSMPYKKKRTGKAPKQAAASAAPAPKSFIGLQASRQRAKNTVPKATPAPAAPKSFIGPQASRQRAKNTPAPKAAPAAPKAAAKKATNPLGPQPTTTYVDYFYNVPSSRKLKMNI
jgi:hypothetical protein